MKLKTIVAGALGLFAGTGLLAAENLVVNGDFEAGTATAQTWGSYFNGGGFSNPGWTGEPEDRVGLGKPDGTWAAAGLDVGTYCLFLQTKGEETVVAYQDVVIDEDGAYLVTFRYSGRPGHLDLAVTATFGEETLGTVTGADTGLSSFSKVVTLTAGTHRLQFTCNGPAGNDLATIIDAVSVTRGMGVARIGEVSYTSLAAALADGKAGTVIDYFNEGDGNASLAAGETLDWPVAMPTVHVAGTLTVAGAVTIDAKPAATGTYTLFTANRIDLASGGGFLLAPMAGGDALTRTVQVTETAVTLTVARNLEAAERVVNGAFDAPGTSMGHGAGTLAGKWGYSYAEGFMLPWWNVPGGDTGSGVGLAVANSDWVAAAQENGGTYTYYAQGIGRVLSQDFGPTPAGVYRLSFNRGGRPNHGGSYWRVGLREDGETVYSYQTTVMNNEKLYTDSSVMALPRAGNYGVAFRHDHPDTGDRAALLDDVSFRLAPIDGWTVADGAARLTAGAVVPAGSYVHGDAAIAAGAKVSVATTPKTYALNVGGTLRLEGPVTLTVEDSLNLPEGDYRLVKAGAIEYAAGASFVLDPALVFRNPTDSGAGWDYFAVLDVTDAEVILRVRNQYVDGTNNYLLPTEGADPDLYTDASRWSRGHAPASDDANIIANNSGSLHFVNAERNLSGATWYVRNGHLEPLVLTAETPDAGYDFRNNIAVGAGDSGTSGWIKFESGSYKATNIFLPCPNGGRNDAESYVEFNGANVALGSNLQCNWSAGCRARVTISAGSVTTDHDFNPNIVGNTHHVFRMTGGTFDVQNFQVYSGLSTFDGEMTGGEIRARNRFTFGDGNSRDSSFTFLHKGGRIRANEFAIVSAEGTDLLFLLAGGSLAPWTATEVWADGATFRVAKGGALRLDSAGVTATWRGATVDTAGGHDYGLVKEGDGVVRLAAAPTAEGPVNVTGGGLVFPFGCTLKGALAVADGAVLAVDLGDAVPAEGDVILTAEGGITLATPAQVQVAGASATLSADGTQLLYAAADRTPVSAVWTGAGDRTNVSDPANWSCRNASGAALDGAVPSALTTITVTGPTSLNVPAGQGLTCGALEMTNVVLTADCDWRGLILDQLMAGTIDLAGHELVLACPYGEPPHDLTVTDTATGDNYVQNGTFSDSVVTGNGGAWSYGANGASSANWALGTSAGIAKAGSPWTDSVQSEPFAAYIQRDDDHAWIRQTVTVPETGRYRLTFWFIPRQAMASGEGVNVMVDGVRAGSVFTSGNFWVPAAIEFDLAAGSHELAFVGNNNGSTDDRSIILDDVALNLVGRGRLVLEVPEGKVFTNVRILLKGALTLVKDGLGTLVTSVPHQDYRGGTEVRAGTLRNNVSGNDKYGLGAVRSAITIKPVATFDDNGMWDVCNYEFVLEGGTLANFGGNLATNGEQGRFSWGALGDVTLTGDSKLVATGNVLFHGFWGNRIELGGHELAVSTGRNYFFLGMPVQNGLVKITSDATMFWPTAEIDASTADFDLACHLEIYNPISVRNWTLRNPESWGGSRAPVKVFGVFTPIADTFCNTELQNGATLNLAMKEGPFNVLSADVSTEVDEETGEGKPYLLSFVDGARVTVDVGDRKLRANEPVVAWNDETRPANVRSVTFKLPPGRRGELVVRDDGLYFFSGLTIIFR